MMKKILYFLKAHPVITAVLAVAVGFAAIKIITPANATTLQQAMLRVVLTCSAFAFLYLISGEKTFKCCQKTTGYVFARLWILLIVPVFFAVVQIAGYLLKDTPTKDGWPLELLWTILLYLFVGLFEETTFRAVVNDALLIRFRNTKGIFVIIAVVSSLIFGAVHVIGADISDPSVLLSAVLKTVSAGLAGLCYMFLYWKTRNLWAIALIHGLYDFTTVFLSSVFVTDVKMASGADRYASAGTSGISSIIYGGQILFGVIVAVILWFTVVRKIDFKELRENW